MIDAQNPVIPNPFSVQGAAFLPQINGHWLHRITFREVKERDCILIWQRCVGRWEFYG